MKRFWYTRDKFDWGASYSLWHRKPTLEKGGVWIGNGNIMSDVAPILGPLKLGECVEITRKKALKR